MQVISHMYEWVMSHMNQSCQILTSHATCEWFMSNMDKSCHIWISYVTCGCHIWRSHVTYEQVMPHMNESCQIWISLATYEWVISRMDVTYKGVMSHMNVSCRLWPVPCHVCLTKAHQSNVTSYLLHAEYACIFCVCMSACQHVCVPLCLMVYTYVCWHDGAKKSWIIRGVYDVSWQIWGLIYLVLDPFGARSLSSLIHFLRMELLVLLLRRVWILQRV